MPRKPGRKIFDKGVKCREMLAVFCETRGISIGDIMGRRRNARIEAARRDFCILAASAGYGSVLVGKAINRSAWTVQYHTKPCIRARKLERNAKRRSDAAADRAGTGRQYPEIGIGG